MSHWWRSKGCSKKLRMVRERGCIQHCDKLACCPGRLRLRLRHGNWLTCCPHGVVPVDDTAVQQHRGVFPQLRLRPTSPGCNVLAAPGESPPSGAGKAACQDRHCLLRHASETCPSPSRQSFLLLSSLRSWITLLTTSEVACSCCVCLNDYICSL